MRKPQAATRSFVMQTIHQVLLACLIGVLTQGVKYVAKIPNEISELRTTMTLAIDKIKDLDRRTERLESRVYKH